MDEEAVTVKLNGRYAGWEARMIADPEWAYIEAIQSAEATRITEGLASCLVFWNFTDRKGQPVPATAEGLRRVPRGAVVGLMNAYSELYRALPNG